MMIVIRTGLIQPEHTIMEIKHKHRGADGIKKRDW